MKRDTEKRMKDIAENATIQEVLPDFDADEQWNTLRGKMSPIRRLSATWAYAAGIAIIACVSTILWLQTKQETDTHLTLAAQKVATPDTMQESPAGQRQATGPAEAEEPEIKTSRRLVVTGKVRNSTPCPIVLCVSQTVKCPNKAHKDLSASSTLEPDQTAELKFNENPPIAANCSLSVKEIEIRSLATGEVILLTSASSPSMVEEVYSYLTGEKKGEILAGAFDHDCNKRKNRQDLRLSNTDGHLVIE
ncbi:MAG: hypothetical protein IAE95_03235 [Chitinophagaceae bacterium]|nr:hypothetical protein [Chitinophagaceae bacterium]